jgi:trk system potassium uptake protein TrkA
LRIVIVGAGAVGSYLAERLSSEGQDVVLVEDDESRAAELQDALDALVIGGNGASPQVLQKADAGRADLLIAVSNNDGANVLACHTAKELGAKRTVARVEDPGLRDGLEDLGVDVVIDPGETAAHELVSLVRQGGVSELIPFADGKLVLVGGLVGPTAPIAYRPLREVRLREGHWGWVVTALVRHGHTTVAHGDTVVQPGDHAILMTTADSVEHATDLLGLRRQRIDRVVVMGSTRLAELTCDELLGSGFSVVLIDPDRGRCTQMAGRHPGAVVLNGDPTDPELLSDLDLGSRDMVLALTGWDEVNILGCLVAKALGAAAVVSRFNRIVYVGLLAGVGIDAAISSRLLAASAILRFVRHGRIQQVATFSDTDAEAIDIEVAPGSPAVDRTLLELELPRGVVVGGISRSDTTFVPDGSTTIRAGDRLIFFALPEDIASSVELFTT